MGVLQFLLLIKKEVPNKVFFCKLQNYAGVDMTYIFDKDFLQMQP